MRIQPKVVELGHHCRELQALTGLNVEDGQARRLLNDLASFTAHRDLGREDRSLVAHRWLTEIYEPITALVPPEARGKLEPAEVFHEVLVHRWYLSERAGHEVADPGRRARLRRPRAARASPRRLAADRGRAARRRPAPRRDTVAARAARSATRMARPPSADAPPAAGH